MRSQILTARSAPGMILVGLIAATAALGAVEIDSNTFGGLRARAIGDLVGGLCQAVGRDEGSPVASDQPSEDTTAREGKATTIPSAEITAAARRPARSSAMCDTPTRNRRPLGPGDHADAVGERAAGLDGRAHRGILGDTRTQHRSPRPGRRRVRPAG